MSRPAQYLIIFVAVGVQVGFTILGRGELAFFFARDAIGVIGGCSRAFGAILLLISHLPPYTDRMNFLTIDGEPTRWVGVVLFTVGCVLRLWPVFVLGKRFSGLVAIQKDHTLVTSGIYSVIRNPRYLGLLITVIGWALAFRSLIGVFLTAVLVPTLIARIRVEETILRS
jgi:protein-S-isoprenylcysteine O-methyltransferase Ste14